MVSSSLEVLVGLLAIGRMVGEASPAFMGELWNDLNGAEHGVPNVGVQGNAAR